MLHALLQNSLFLWVSSYFHAWVHKCGGVIQHLVTQQKKKKAVRYSRRAHLVTSDCASVSLSFRYCRPRASSVQSAASTVFT